MSKLQKIGPLFVIVAASLWALDGIVLRPELYSLPVPLVVFVEHAIAFLFMTPLLLYEFKELKKMKKGDWGAFFWVAVFGGAIGTMFITKALFYVHFVNLSIVILLQKLQPVFALLLAALILKEKLPKKFFYYAIAAIIGGYLVTFGLNQPEFSTGNKTFIAALFALGAAFAFGSATVFGKRGLKNINFRMGTYIRFGLTTLVMFFIASATGDIMSISQITQKQLITFLIIVFSTGGLAIFLYYYGLKWITASVSTICELAFPLSAVVLEFLIRGNILSLAQWGGAALMLYAMYKVTVMRPKIE